MHRLEAVSYSRVSVIKAKVYSSFTVHSCHLSLMHVILVEGRAVAYEPLASNFDWKKIQEELQEMGESINCDVEFEEVYEL